MRSYFKSLSLHRIFLALAFAIGVPLTGSIAARAFDHSAPNAHITLHRTTSTVANNAYFALNSQWSTAAQNARLSAINTAAASGFIDIYTGSQPATANSTITGTLLCSIPLGATAFHAPSSGTMTNNGATSCVAGATGTAGYVIMYKTGHTSADVLWMGSVGTSGANLNLATVAISSGVTVSLADAALTITDDASISGQ